MDSVLYASAPKGEVEQIIHLAEDQHFIREELARLELAAFVADGSVLPRESGVSDRPMKNAVPFQAPESMAVTLELPHRGPVRGPTVPGNVVVDAPLQGFQQGGFSDTVFTDDGQPVTLPQAEGYLAELFVITEK